MLVLVLGFGISSSNILSQNQSNNAVSNNAAANNTNSNSASNTNAANANANANTASNNANRANKQNNANQASSNNINEDESGDSFDDGSSAELNKESLTIDENPDTLRHPKAASKWRTQELVMAASLPPMEKIEACQNEVRALASKAINQEMMLESRNLLTQSIVKAPAVYHWCFYLTMVQLDQRLMKQDMTASFAMRYKQFIEDMKQMWIHARALDAALRTRRYFGYIRRRYIELMKENFGRDTTVISAPLGDKERRVIPNPPKPAE